MSDLEQSNPDNKAKAPARAHRRGRSWTPGIALALLGLLATLALAGCGEESEATPTATPVAPAEQGADATWAAIQDRGILIVGTSADYAPFEFYDAQLQLDGLDIALIEEIGRRLGLAVEIRDMAFDGLGNALLVGQIDLAISAISDTEDRRQFVDFSSTYFVGSDALLARADAPFDQITLVEDIAELRLGVERGTVYDSWAQTNLVETGLMPIEHLFRYEKIDGAITDLITGRIDLVALDLQPAETTVESGLVKLVAQGLNDQDYAIAVPKGALELLSQLNQTLFDLQGDGSLSQLIEQYIGLPEEAQQPLPTPDLTPPQASQPAQPPGGCLDSAEYVADLSYDHQELSAIPEFAPGEAFQKGWRLRNSGTCAWDNNYSLTPVGSNVPAGRMGGGPVQVQGTVAPGETYDFFVDLVAPIEPGSYVGYWNMRDNQSGLLFGEKVAAAAEVVTVLTPTPLPTQTPAPGIAFSGSPEVIQEGQCASLTWATQNVRAVYLYEQGENWQANGVQGRGTLTVCPPTTTTYELRVIKNDGTAEIRRVTIFVNPNPSVPQISRFTVDPPDLVALGQCVTIQWSVEGSVSTVNISRNGTVIWPNAPFGGALQDCPSGLGQQAYGLEATGPGGTSRAQWVVSVVSTGQPVPTSTPTVAPGTPTPSSGPAIYYFQAQPSQIATNSCVTLSWSVGGNANRVELLKNNQTVQSGAVFRGSWSDCGNSAVGTVIYRLQAQSSSNQTVIEQQVVTVMPG